MSAPPVACPVKDWLSAVSALAWIFYFLSHLSVVKDSTLHIPATGPGPHFPDPLPYPTYLLKGLLLQVLLLSLLQMTLDLAL